MLLTALNVLNRVALDVLGALRHNWPYLLASVVIAAALSVYFGTDRLASWLRRRRWIAVAGAVLLATLTPFCSCGTTAMVLGMLATKTPWAPVVAFMVASPLTSPSELMLSVGLFGWSFALLYFVGAAALGLAAGGVAGWVEDRGWLVGQARMRPVTTGCGDPAAAESAACSGQAPESTGGGSAVATMTRVDTGTRASVATRLARRYGLRALALESVRLGRRILAYFLAYSAIAYLVLELVPARSLVNLLGGDAVWSVPLAALVGIPVYITSEGSLPMVAALMSGGLGAGAAMAFLITGAGTSIPAISGALIIARRRVVGLVVALLFAGAVVLGWLTALTLG
jgi:uncharacterized protein